MSNRAACTPVPPCVSLYHGSCSLANHCRRLSGKTLSCSPHPSHYRCHFAAPPAALCTTYMHNIYPHSIHIAAKRASTTRWRFCTRRWRLRASRAGAFIQLHHCVCVCVCVDGSGVHSLTRDGMHGDVEQCNMRRLGLVVMMRIASHTVDVSLLTWSFAYMYEHYGQG